MPRGVLEVGRRPGDLILRQRQMKYLGGDASYALVISRLMALVLMEPGRVSHERHIYLQ
jgi:hypothetical protein